MVSTAPLLGGASSFGGAKPDETLVPVVKVMRATPLSLAGTEGATTLGAATWGRGKFVAAGLSADTVDRVVSCVRPPALKVYWITAVQSA
jgi:hypothetical protein